MSQHFRQERRKIPRPEAPRPGLGPKETGGGGNRAGQPVHAPTTSPRNSRTERSVCSVHPPPHSCRLPHPSRPSAQADLSGTGGSPAKAPAARRVPCGPHQAPLTTPSPWAPPQPQSSSPIFASFSSSHWVPPTPIFIPKRMSHSEQVTVRAGRHRRDLQVREGN